MDFDFGSVQKWWDGTWDIGKGISDVIVDELLKGDTFRLVERRRLDMILAEKNLTNTSRENVNQAAEIGKIVGANAMITGSVTQFGTENKTSAFGGLFGRLATAGVGGIGRQKGKAKVTVTARIVDAVTGEIIASASGEGVSNRSGLLLGGIGAGKGTVAAAGLSISSSDFRETILGEATYAAITTLVKNLVAMNDKIPAGRLEIRGKIAFIDAARIVINVGIPHGVQVGDILQVSNVKNTIKDPDTGKVLREETEELGQIRIEEVDANSSAGSIIAGSGFQIGNLVTKK